MGEYVYRMDDEEKMAQCLESSRQYGHIALRLIKPAAWWQVGPSVAATRAAHYARQYMMLRAVTGRD